jgi:AcrR family transcriptional regulator
MAPHRATFQGPPLARGATIRLRGEERREAILDAAQALYLEHGPVAVSTRRIAEAVGISQPSLYAHFPTKHAITLALSARAFGVMEASLEAGGHVPGSGGLAELAGSIRSYIAFALAEPTAYRIAFMVEVADPPGEEEVRCLPGYQVYSRFAASVAAMQHAGLLRATAPGVLAQSLWAGMHGLCALLLARPTFPWAELAGLVDAHVELLVAGAARRTPPHT